MASRENVKTEYSCKMFPGNVFILYQKSQSSIKTSIFINILTVMFMH